MCVGIVNSDNNPRGSYYWSKQTGEFEGQNTVTFGSNMNGVSNPIVTSFNPHWPVCTLYLIHKYYNF